MYLLRVQQVVSHSWQLNSRENVRHVPYLSAARTPKSLIVMSYNIMLKNNAVYKAI